MTNTVALILAAGEAHRMNGVIKQLLPVGDRTILGRILYQLHLHETRSIVVTHKKEISDFHHPYYTSGGNRCPENNDTTCDSLLSMAHLWDDRTIVLLGDVVYSNYTMGLIMNSTDLIRVFGNTWEIFAIVFDKRNHAKVKTALRKGSKHRRGKLRYFYHAYCGLEMGMKETETVPPEQEVFYYVRDWTRDIDSAYEYDRLNIEIVDNGLL